MKKNLLTILYFFLSINLIFADTSQIKIDSIIINVSDYTEAVQEIRKLDEESLLLYINANENDLAKVKIYNALCWKCFSSDPPKAMEYAKLQYALAKDIKDEEAIVKAYDNLAWLHQGSSNHEVSIKFMLKALKINERIGDQSGVSMNLSGLANNYFRLNNYPLALNYFEQSLKIEQLTGQWGPEAATLTNIGLCYVEMDKIDKGLATYLEAVNIYVRNKQEIEAAATYSNIGLVYLDNKKNYVKALFYFKKAAKFHEQTKDVSALSLNYDALSKLYIEQHDFTKALFYGEKALENAKISKNKNDLKVAQENLALVFYNKKNYQLAYDHFKIAYSLNDTIYNLNSAQQIAEMQTKYDTEKKEAENKLLIAKQKLDQVNIDKKTTQQNWLLLLLALVFFVVVYIFYSLQQKKKTNKLLLIKNDKINTQKAIIEEKNKDITDSINYAQRIQDAILPDLTVLSRSYESFVYFEPKDIIGGDFYWVKEIGNKLFFSVIDCTGHGVPGALMSMIGYNSLNKIVEDLKIEDPGKILDELNKLVIQSFNKGNTTANNVVIKDGMDISICVIDKLTNKMVYAGANNSLYLYRAAKNKIEMIEPDMENETAIFYETKPSKMKVGGGDNSKNYLSHTVQLVKEDTIYLFSDGYVDQFGGEKGKKFMYKPFKRMLLSIQNKPMDKQLLHLDKTMKDWKGGYEQLDDICIMGVRIG